MRPFGILLKTASMSRKICIQFERFIHFTVSSMKAKGKCNCIVHTLLCKLHSRPSTEVHSVGLETHLFTFIFIFFSLYRSSLFYSITRCKVCMLRVPYIWKMLTSFISMIIYLLLAVVTGCLNVESRYGCMSKRFGGKRVDRLRAGRCK